MTESKQKISKKAAEETVKTFKGRFIEEVGKRKTATARVRLYKSGEGIMIVNSKNVEEYLTPTLLNLATTPLKLSGHNKDFNFSILVAGGGMRGQAEAIRHGITKALIMVEKNLRPVLKAKGLVTRDSRIKERKKPGLKKARKAPQWAKR
jgi:small subunit ribosomal protein S9